MQTTYFEGWLECFNEDEDTKLADIEQRAQQVRSNPFIPREGTTVEL